MFLVWANPGLGGASGLAFRLGVDPPRGLAKSTPVLTFELDHPALRLGILAVDDVRWGPSDRALLAALEAAEERVCREPSVFPEPVRVAVRDVLRSAGYKPTGRGKPASELLFSLAQKRAFPRIGNLVDANNLASLEHALPISMFDADRLGPEPAVRFGRAGESYVFNGSGQSMELVGLPVVCRGGQREPIGNPVRDSMLGKVHEGTTRVVAVVYSSRALSDALLVAALARLQSLLELHAQARRITSVLLP